MRDVGPSGDANSGASASGGPPPSEPPPSSTRGFIGTNTDAAQAYVPPTALPETPEPPVPNAKVALSDNVDPRKAPTYPNLKKAAQSIASEMASEIASERPPPIIEAPPDSQSSGIRRGAGYAPSREARQSLSRSGSNFLPPAALRPGADPPQRNTPVKPMPKISARPSPATDTTETPAQRRAALALIFLFAALLAVAVYFFLRKAPPHGGSPSEPTGAALSGAPTAPPSASPARSSAPAPSISPATDPSPSTSATPSGASSPPPATTGAPSRAPGSDAPADPPPDTPGASPTPSPPASTPPASSASASATAAPAGPDKPKTERWF